LKNSSKAKLIDGLIGARTQTQPTTKKRLAPTTKEEPKLGVTPKKPKVEKLVVVEKVEKAPVQRHIPTVYENGKLISKSPEMKARLLLESDTSSSRYAINSTVCVC
jgi:hypothetical protein